VAAALLMKVGNEADRAVLGPPRLTPVANGCETHGDSL